MTSQQPDPAAFYDRWSATFLATFGDTFQSGLVRDPASGREDPVHSSLMLADRAGVRDGERLLDVGCGVAGPAIAVARGLDVRIHGVTNSPEQVRLARARVHEAGLADRVDIHLADMHRLPFRDASFDRVLCLEVLCYSGDLTGLMTELARVVRPGGVVFAKDVFLREGPLEADARRDMDVYEERWACVRTPTMGETVQAMRAAGLSDVEAAELSDVGTDHFFGSMLDPATLSLNDVGRHFLTWMREFPVVWGSVRATRSRQDDPTW